MSRDSNHSSDSTPDTGHSYDGIREYDNPLPGWWVAIFWASIIGGAGYLFLAFLPPALFSGPTQLAAEQAAADARLFGALPPDLKADDATVLKFSQDEKWIGIGRSIFGTNCVTCHGDKAQGGAGPNLTDDAYIYAKTPADIADVIAKGRKSGAMPAWAGSLSNNQILMVTAYVASLRGTNQPGKAPEGAVPDTAWGQSAKKK